MNAIFWHRRDLRISDNACLHKALGSGYSVHPVFIFDSNILSLLKEDDQRVLFIYQEITRLKTAYNSLGTDLIVRFGDPKALIPELVNELAAQEVFANRDYEPYALERDKFIFEKLKTQGKSFTGTKDHVIFDRSEVMKADGSPYTVFTPYSRRWKEKINAYYLKGYPVEKYTDALAKKNDQRLITLNEMGFRDEQKVDFPPRLTNEELVRNYHATRDIPSIKGTSRLSLHLRFGTISIRELTRFAIEHNSTFLNELIWRDFYQMIIYHFPHSANDSFKKQYDRIEWERNEVHFKAWCEGKTGYPLVDAGMRELNATGFMHNRVRMVVASFLTKHLLLDWRLGEAYFAEKLLDYELASNIGGWQWAAGCGCDAAPYFRVFNPQSQLEKFDRECRYVRTWVPEFGTPEYPQPIVEHKYARERAITRYKQGLTQ
ncbi:MAG: cryptochrome/photolyase family protein [Bacteroidota bacterium]